MFYISALRRIIGKQFIPAGKFFLAADEIHEKRRNTAKDDTEEAEEKKNRQRHATGFRRIWSGETDRTSIRDSSAHDRDDNQQKRPPAPSWKRKATGSCFYFGAGSYLHHTMIRLAFLKNHTP